MTNTTTLTRTRMLHSLADLYYTFEQNRDAENVLKMKELINKAVENEVQLAFCGHFSAGKSSMINYLVGNNILPSSPIPTSANVVKVKQGADGVRIHFFDGTHTTFHGEHDMKDIKAYCKDGDQVRSIEIYSEEFPLPSDCAVLDTPGIDSTDDAHRVSTESTLHLADIILYVMDYNHVQSQENFLFAKKMSEAGKKLYLIVNMIDKHDESELSFEQFKDSVKNSFAAWNIEPLGIFYTSLRNMELPANEISTVKQFINDKIQYEREHLEQSILRSAEQIAEDHLLFIKQKQKEEIECAEQLLSPLQDEEIQELMEKLHQLDLEKQKMQGFSDKFHLEMLKELNELLKNAYLLSAESREMIKSFLESQQDGFKVGMFFAKNKTEQEKSVREETLYKELQERTKTQLEWHLRIWAENTLKQSGVTGVAELETFIQQFTVTVEMNEIKALVMKQSEITGDYVLNFSQNVAEMIKKQARMKCIAFLDQLKLVIEEEQSGDIEEIEKQLDELKQYEKALNLLQSVKAEESSLRQQMKEIIDGSFLANAQGLDQLLKQMKEEEASNEKPIDSEKLQKIEQKTETGLHDRMVAPVIINSSSDGSGDLLRWSEKLEIASQQLQDVQGFSTIVGELQEKANRMKQQTYTIALFGAFSAGKSSFANALFGEKVLPVSPNPTTAVINKVMAPDNDFEHRTAKVTLKNENMLLDDVKLACNALQAYPETLEEAYDFADKLDYTKNTGGDKEKVHLSFVRAFHKGYPLLKDKLGQQLKVDYDEYTAFAADESKSCFVDEIVLHFDCELTKKGIVLVDTPGADSINARHTNAAFHYIKNSDAILFVTYYNHPFAKADREFLIQLGRVKDAFSMDKMFFICNAIDLAQEEEELSDVMQYIKGQLEGFGIRFPRLFPISSKEALQEINSDYTFKHPFLQNSGMAQFQQAFSHFIQHELIDLACSSAKATVERGLHQLQEMIAVSQSSAAQKQERLQLLEKQYEELRTGISEYDTEIDGQKLTKENEELLYYIHQRVFLRFQDFFKESFNPANLQEDGRDLKAALRNSLQELLNSIGFDFEQEMRATSVRLEAFIQKLVKNNLAHYRKLVEKTWSTVEIGDFSVGQYEVPEYSKAFAELDASMFKKELSLFKNPKSFFEKNEKQKMAEAIQAALQNPAQNYLNKEGTKAKIYYNELLQNELQQLRLYTEKVIEDVFTSLTSVLKENVDVTAYSQKVMMLHQLLQDK